MWQTPITNKFSITKYNLGAEIGGPSLFLNIHNAAGTFPSLTQRRQKKEHEYQPFPEQILDRIAKTERHAAPPF
jgi:hypothetical protein